MLRHDKGSAAHLLADSPQPPFSRRSPCAAVVLQSCAMLKRGLVGFAGIVAMEQLPALHPEEDGPVKIEG